MRNIRNIHFKPTVIDNVHESCYRSYSILEYVLLMIDRGDSKETIFDVVDYLNQQPIDTETTKPSKKD